jgi:hypothetical protein
MSKSKRIKIAQGIINSQWKHPKKIKSVTPSPKSLKSYIVEFDDGFEVTVSGSLAEAFGSK